MTGSVRGAPSSSGPRPGTGLQPQDTVKVGQIRGWIDAMRPELGLRDEVADLIVLAWAALRQRAWYHHGGRSRRPRPGPTRPDMELRPEPLPAPADWQAATSRAEALFGIRVNPYLTAAGVAEFTEKLRVNVDTVADPAAALVPRVEGLTVSSAARRPAGPPGDRPRGACGGGAAPDGEPGAPGGDPGQATLPAHGYRCCEFTEPGGGCSAAVDEFRWDRLGPLRRPSPEPMNVAGRPPPR